MTEFVFDTEFLDHGDTLMGVSIGVCAVSAGEVVGEFYAVNAALDDSRVSSGWLGENVWPYLPTRISTSGRFYEVLDRSHPAVLERAEMRAGLTRFFADCADGAASRLWAWYGASDLVVLSRFMGGFLELPGWAQVVRDLRVAQLDAGVSELPVQSDREHHALSDARWNVEVGRVLDLW